MKTRDALIHQGPSLALQRAAQAELAAADALADRLAAALAQALVGLEESGWPATASMVRAALQAHQEHRDAR